MNAHERSFNEVHRELSLNVDGAPLGGTLVIPKDPQGLVLFAHGSGSSRHSPRNQYVAGVLNAQQIGTLLFDLLTPREEAKERYTGEFRFDIPFLARRLIGVTKWAHSAPEIRGLSIGYFGASTGAAAALIAAAEFQNRIAAVVSRGGRPDLADAALSSVRSPTLLIVGGNDEPVIAMNETALANLRCHDKKLIVIPGATHLFEEPGALEEVARLAAEWFKRCFTPGEPRGRASD